MTEAERDDLREQVTLLVWAHVAMKRRQHAILDAIEANPEQTVLIQELLDLCARADALMELIESGWAHLNDEADDNELGGSTRRH